MKVFLLANNIVGLQICQFLREAGDEIVGLAIHPKEKQKCTDEIVKASGMPPELIFAGESLREPATLEKIRSLGAEIAIAAFWGVILKKPFLDLFPRGCINFHPAYLPYSRGMNPNVWPIVEHTPAGVSLHFVNENIDEGDIIARRKVEIEPTDTGGSLYDKTLVQIVELFKENWDAIKKGEIKPIDQTKMEHTFHYARDIEKLDVVELGRQCTAQELIDQIRSRTYGNSSYAYFIDGKERKVEIGIFLRYKEEKK